MKTYCQKCGFGIEYTLEKPKFCSKCGCSLDYTASASTTPLKTQKESIQQININKPQNEEIDTVPEIENIKFEVIGSNPQKTTLKHILKQELQNPHKSLRLSKNKKKNYEGRPGLSKEEMKNIAKTFFQFDSPQPKPSTNIGGEE